MQGQFETSGSGVTVPAWSGSFWVTDECVGIMTIWSYDQTRYDPPRGWVLDEYYVDQVDEEEGGGECQVLYYRYDWEEFLRD